MQEFYVGDLCDNIGLDVFRVELQMSLDHLAAAIRDPYLVSCTFIHVGLGTALMLGYLCDNIGLWWDVFRVEVQLLLHHLAVMTKPSGIPILSPVLVSNPFLITCLLSFFSLIQTGSNLSCPNPLPLPFLHLIVIIITLIWPVLSIYMHA